MDVVDAWTGCHALAGVLAGALAVRLRIGLALSGALVVAGAFAWEWLEAAGFGPVGQDSNPLNSLVDVAIAMAGWAVMQLSWWRPCQAAPK